jgi:hypothetical protein
MPNNDPILTAIQRGGVAVADDDESPTASPKVSIDQGDPILNAITGQNSDSGGKWMAPTDLADYVKQNGGSIGRATRTLRGQGYELVHSEDVPNRDPKLRLQVNKSTIPLGAPLLQVGASAGLPQSLSQSLAPPPIDATKIPLNPFTDQYETQPPMATAEEQAANGTLAPAPQTIGSRVKRALGAGAPEGSEMANLTGQRGVRNPDEMRLFAPEQLMTESEQQRHPVLTGAGEFAGSMTTPENLAILGLTGAAGEFAGPGAVVAKRMLAAGFSMPMLIGAAKMAPDVSAAFKRGDTATAKRLLTHMVLGASLAGLAGRGMFEESASPFAAKLPGTPETIGAGEKLTPETLATLNAQTDALAAGTNKVVYFPKGQKNIPEPPENATVTVVPGEKQGAGTYYHTEDVTPEQIKAAVDDGSYGKLLGFTQPKEQAVAAGKPTTVVARDSNGTELKAGLVDSSNPQAVAEQAAEFARQFPESKIGVEPPEKVIAKRQEREVPGTVIPPESSAVTSSPNSPPGDRWTGDRGAMPGEPAYFLDGETADTAKATIIEIEDPRQLGRATFEAHLPDGELIGRFGTTEEAARHAEKVIDSEKSSHTAVSGETPQVERRSATSIGTPPAGIAERRTQAQQDYQAAIESTPPGQSTPGEQLSQDIRTVRAGAPSTVTEGDALQRIMRDPTAYEKYQAADQKARDRMLVNAKNEMVGAKNQPDAILDAIQGNAGQGLNFRQKTEPRIPRTPPTKQQPLTKRYSPETLEEARQELTAAHQLASSFERQGRYFAEEDPLVGMPSRSTNAAKGIHAGGTWYGISSSKHIVADQFPWYGEIEQGAGRIGKLIEKGKGAEYNRLLAKVAESVQREKESAAPVIAEFAPKLRELSGRIDGNDQDLSDSLAQLANSDGRGFKNLREYIQGKVTDAERANSFFAAIDDAATEAREAGTSETSEHGNGLRAGESGRAASRTETSAASTSEGPSSPAFNETPETSEANRLTAEASRRQPPTEEQNTLPGMEQDVEEQRAGAARVQGERLGEEANRPLGNIDQAAGEMERSSPLFRGKGPQGELYSGVHPKALIEGARVVQRAWEENIAQPFIDRVLKIGDKYKKAREADPAVAEGLHLLDNAPTYLRAKAAQVVKDVIGNLSRAQERLFTLMADTDSRENLRMNHPEEYAQAQADPAIQEALRKYRPLEQELTTLRERMGGQTLEQDYLRRVYDKYVAGVNKAEAPGTSERGTSAFDRVIRPQRTDKLSREATSEYHYENGLHEFGPAFATKFIGTHLKALRDQLAKEFLSKATMLPTGASEPRFIDYNGQRYYRPDVAKDLRDAGSKDVKVYDRYDPTAGEKFPVPVDGKYLGPRELVKTLTDFGRREEGEPGALRRFFQEQVLGFGFGVPHVANIMRRVSQTVPGGAVNPQGWARAWKVVLSKELRDRGISGLSDPTFDMLAKHGAISTGEVSNLKAYMGGNLNPANWARALAQVGHKFLFEPTAAKGFGGLDQRARLYIADLVQSQRPDLSEAKIAEAVRTQLGDYNRANWTDQQKMLSKFMMFPGWDFSSIRWVLQHPIKTTVPPALAVLLANRTLNYFGQNRDEDRDDISNIHIGDRSYGTSLLRESVAQNLFRPAIAFAQSKFRGESNQRAFDAASRGITAGAGGLLSMLRPDLSGFLALATNRQGLFSSKEIVSQKDWGTPGKVLPSKALEKQAVFTVRHALPALDRILDSNEDVDLRSFLGGNLGVPNYKYGAEQRLARNTAEANRTYQAISGLAKKDPEKALAMLKDPDNATYALFHNDLQQATAALHKIDQVRETVDASNAPDAEKQKQLEALDNFRKAFLDHADALNNLLFKRRMQRREAIPATPPGIPRRPPAMAAAQ